MAQIFPSKQTMVDQRDDVQVLVTNIKILSATTDHVKLPNASDAQLLQAAKGTADPVFYLSSAGAQFNIDGATIGTEYIVVSRHDGGMNYYRGTADANNPR